MEEWDIISPKDVIGSEQLIGDKARSFAATALPFTQSLLSQVAEDIPHPVGQLFYQPLSAALTQVSPAQNPNHWRRILSYTFNV